MRKLLLSKRTQTLAVALLFAMILVAGCSSLRESFREPKQFEVQELISKQGLTHLADTSVNVNKILLVKGENSFGYFVTTVREPEEELVWSSILSNLTDDPLNYIAVASGDPYIIGVFVQDEALLESTESVVVSMSDGTEIEHPLNDQGGAVLQGSPEAGSQLVSVSLIGAGGEEIYRLER